jgi:predicted dehydrogenase
MKIAIVGTGLIGKERIEAVQNISKLTNNLVNISSVFDINTESLENAKAKYNVPIVHNFNDLGGDNPDWIFVVTPNDVVYDVAKKAFDMGANVLVEKPFGRNLEECDKIISLKPEHLKLHVGFNYRFFAGIEQAIKDAKSGKFGKLISVNMILGHGNAPGMEKSWKLDPKRCGNVTTDLAVHLFDIMLQLSNSPITVEYCRSWKGFWNTGIEEEAHFISHNDDGTIFNSQVSLNRWRSTFKLEINGTEGYGIVDHRGRSYGPQSYRIGKRWGWLSDKNIKQADTENWIIQDNDCLDSFTKETISHLGLQIAGYENLLPPCSHINARDIMQLLNQLELKRIMI